MKNDKKKFSPSLLLGLETSRLQFQTNIFLRMALQLSVNCFFTAFWQLLFYSSFILLLFYSCWWSTAVVAACLSTFAERDLSMSHILSTTQRRFWMHWPTYTTKTWCIRICGSVVLVMGKTWVKEGTWLNCYHFNDLVKLLWLKKKLKTHLNIFTWTMSIICYLRDKFWYLESCKKSIICRLPVYFWMPLAKSRWLTTVLKEGNNLWISTLCYSTCPTP